MDIAPDDDDNANSAREGLYELTGYQLRRVSNVFSAHFAQAMTGTGLRQVLFGILSVIDANPGINQGAVGRVLGIQRANMVSLINDLVDRGLIDRQTADDDRRAFTFTLTTQGHRTLADALRRVEAHEVELLASLTPAEQRTLVTLLKRIGDNGSA